MLGRRSVLDTSIAELRARARRFVAERRMEEKISRLHARLLEAREGYRLSPDHIERAVGVAQKLRKTCT